MAHHLSYIQLAWHVGIALFAFRQISQFAIKMIAIFARDKFSARAFEVLKLGQRRQTISGRASGRPRVPRREIAEKDMPRAGTGIPLTQGRRGDRVPGRRPSTRDSPRWGHETDAAR
jgi:hypothetical protein